MRRVHRHVVELLGIKRRRHGPGASILAGVDAATQYHGRKVGKAVHPQRDMMRRCNFRQAAEKSHHPLLLGAIAHHGMARWQPRRRRDLYPSSPPDHGMVLRKKRTCPIMGRWRQAYPNPWVRDNYAVMQRMHILRPTSELATRNGSSTRVMSLGHMIASSKLNIPIPTSC